VTGIAILHTYLLHDFEKHDGNPGLDFGVYIVVD